MMDNCPTPMRSADLAQADLTNWVMQCGLEGAPRETLLQGYCDRLVGMGVPLMRLHVAQSAFHPKFGGLGFTWDRGDGVESEQYEYSAQPPEQWRTSPLYHLLQSGAKEMRERLRDSDGPSRFPILNDLTLRGATDYFAAGVVLEPFNESVAIDPDNTPEGLLISWCSDGPEGFDDADVARFRATLPALALALKSAANRRMATDLLGVYLGRDAGARVLSGEFGRGSLQKLEAVICYFDLEGFTRLAEETEGAALVTMLNAYFGVVVDVIENNGGHVLKFMGDGLLALFGDGGPQECAAASLRAASQMRDALDALNRRRKAQGGPHTTYTLALHAGEILYGNVGGEQRLDFTAIGPAVNLTARLAGMHRAVGQGVIVSQEVHRLAAGGDHDLVSLGRYMLRGVAAPQELFTIHDPRN